MALSCESEHDHGFYGDDDDEDLENYLLSVEACIVFYEDPPLRKRYLKLSAEVKCEMERRKKLWEGLYSVAL